MRVHPAGKNASNTPLPEPWTADTQGFPGSAAYWEARYAGGNTSGAGSYGTYAQFKANVVNFFMNLNGVESVIEWGCGDGNQLTLLRPTNYLGMDVSQTAVKGCQKLFESDVSKSFMLYDDNNFIDHGGFLKADMSMSLEVIFHLVEDDVFDRYMRRLFNSARSYVLIFASDIEKPQMGHMRERRFTSWVEANMPGWTLNMFVRGPEREEGTDSNFYCFAPRP